MIRREWLGVWAAWVRVLVSLPVLAAGGPYVVGVELGAAMWARMPALMALADAVDLLK